jgi:hypothetical protein
MAHRPFALFYFTRTAYHADAVLAKPSAANRAEEAALSAGALESAAQRDGRSGGKQIKNFIRGVDKEGEARVS